MNNLNFIHSSSKEQCERENMEDVYNIHHCEKSGCWIFNVCDGHGGYKVAEYINEYFIKYVMKNISENKINNENDMIESLNNVITVLDEEIREFPCSEHVGSTMVSVIFYNNYFYFINIGDSNIICNTKPNAYYNELHNLENKKEIMRINKNSYISNGRIEGVINLTRAFGDFKYKKNGCKDSPIITTPVIDYIHIDKITEYNHNPFFLLASDGLTILFTRKQLLKTIELYLECGYSSQKIVSLLTKYCCKKKNVDNIAIILCVIRQDQPNEKLANELEYIKKNINKIDTTDYGIFSTIKKLIKFECSQEK